MEEKFLDRINYSGDVESLLTLVCEEYTFGSYIGHKLVLMGYEDCNIILETNTGKYFIKIFANFRDLNECQRYIDIMVKANEAKIATPLLYKSSQGHLCSIPNENKTTYLCAMNYVDGSTLHELSKELTPNQILFLAKQLSLINSLDHKPSTVHDSWAIVNFVEEFKKKSSYLSKDDLSLIQPVHEKFASVDLTSLPHCFVHGDIISTNVMIDNNSNLHIIDFSVANYYPRIQELAVLACNILFNPNSKGKSDYNLNLFLTNYQKKISLSDKELSLLPLYIKAAHAMHLLSANYEKVKSQNNSEENEFWLSLGRRGLLQTRS